MVRTAKKATQDGTYTVYLDEEAVAWGLSRLAADALIESLTISALPRLRGVDAQL
jgi:hypothetical protein